jgi:LruC domain-containing protein
MNDLVVNYRYSYNVNANNEVVEMKADYKVNQSLAYYKNGFGVELPINQNVIDDVRGYINSGKYIKYNQNGTEAGQAKAVIIPFDNQKLIFDGKVNYSEPIRVLIEFLKPQSINILNAAPYNPFLISDGRRSYEIHLPGFTPTSLADKNLFGSLQDLSNPAQGKYYIGENNWPWALSFVEPFNYPSEGQAVNLAYPNFNAWAASGGTQFKDWYK